MANRVAKAIQLKPRVLAGATSGWPTPNIRATVTRVYSGKVASSAHLKALCIRSWP
ncbi:hypothetical protein D3C76_1692510 [compost metagenome]